MCCFFRGAVTANVLNFHRIGLCAWSIFAISIIKPSCSIKLPNKSFIDIEYAYRNFRYFLSLSQNFCVFRQEIKVLVFFVTKSKHELFYTKNCLNQTVRLFLKQEIRHFPTQTKYDIFPMRNLKILPKSWLESKKISKIACFEKCS